MNISQQNGEALISLCGCALKGLAPERELVAAMDLDAVLELAAFHKLSALCAWALERGGLGDERTRGLILAAQRRAIIFQHALEDVKAALEARGIWYVPLKGILLQRLYPACGLREMVDYDLLIDASRAEELRTIMENLGYSTASFGESKHDVYYKAPCLNMQMHTSLFSPVPGEPLYDYFRDAPQRLLGEGCYKHFSPEDFYLHLLAHEYAHYAGGGTGLRSLLDTWLYLRANALDMDYIAAETEKLGLRDFEEKNRALAGKLFSGEALDADEREMLEYIVASGAHGTFAHIIDSKLNASGGSKGRFLLRRFLVPFSRSNPRYAAYAAHYPWFYRHRLRLLLLPFYRVFRAMCSGRLQTELRALRKARRQKPSPGGEGGAARPPQAL